MRIAVVGVGGVGGYFGARLAYSGEDVAFIARGAHLDAMRETGLHIKSPVGDLHMASVTATDNPSEVGPVDAVLLAVKTWQLPEAIQVIHPLLGPDAAVVPLLNGVDAPKAISAALGAQHALGGLCGIVAHIDGPGRIKHVGVDPFVRFGELDNTKTPRVEALQAAFARSAVGVDIPDDITAAMWQKFLFIAPTSGIGSITRTTFGVMREMPETRDLVERAMREALEVGQAEGVALTDGHLAKALAALDAAPANGTTSMQRDFETRRPSELEAQTGSVVRMGKNRGVATPLNDVFYRCLLPQELRARGELEF